MQKRTRIPKWLKWEFWPYRIFYIPVYFLIVVHAIRARTLSYFTLSNPGMKMGGFASYSKYDILSQLPSSLIPKTILFTEIPSTDFLLAKMQTASIIFPVILKPDEGERGWKVEKISNEGEVRKYLSDAPQRMILQEYIDLPEEYGIMYYRFPQEKKGNISSVMKREFLTVTGDGTSTLLELFQQSERGHYYLARLSLKFKNELGTVLPEGEVKMLEEIGNHNRGTAFLDAHELINEQLLQVFDETSSSLKEFYFGRYDVRTQSYEELLRGNFKVMEVNGANSEPTHIYDPDMSLMKAYRDLFHHWKTMFRISMQNRKRGFKAASMPELYRAIQSHLREKKEHPNEF
ncbi:MAG: hypothetical protein ABIO46_12605 [Chitinophagales bacterium]